MLDLYRDYAGHDLLSISTPWGQEISGRACVGSQVRRELLCSVSSLHVDSAIPMSGSGFHCCGSVRVADAGQLCIGMRGGTERRFVSAWAMGVVAGSFVPRFGTSLYHFGYIAA